MDDDDDYFNGGIAAAVVVPAARSPLTSPRQRQETAMEPTFVPIFLLSPDRKNEVVREIA